MTTKKMNSSKSETAIVKETERLLSFLRGFKFWRQNTGAFRVGNRFVRFGTAGQADITGIGPGGVRIEIELKRPKSPGKRAGLQSADQIRFASEIESLGGVYVLAYSAEEVVLKLREKFHGHVF